MYLCKDELEKVAQSAIQPFNKKQLGSVSYDLSVLSIYDPKEKKNHDLILEDHYDLRPHETIFIGSDESVSLPKNCIATIQLRYSLIRMGITYETPVYQPGHKTRIFTRITNTSDTIIRITHRNCIVSIMFDQLDQDIEPYEGKFKEQFDFKDVGNVRSTSTPEVITDLAEEAEENGVLQKLDQAASILALTSLVLAFMNLLLNAFKKKN
jgi:deoxycytidine triphosphate deaminase